jgi:hypothetical protein
MKNLWGRLRRARVWVALQFGLTLVLIVAGLAWTRLPDKHAWQVALSLLIPVLLVICALELQAGTVRKLADDDGRRVKLVWGAVTLLVWVAVGAALWALLDWFDDQIPLLAGYLNSKGPAQARATVFTYEHIRQGLTALEWVLRWVVVPAKLISLGAASTMWAWRLPWRRLVRFMLSWRWWVGVLAVALVGVWLPGQFFNGTPKGSVTAQEWAVTWKLALFFALPDPPGLDELPVDVDGVVQVQQQAFAAIEKAEPEKVVIEEGRRRIRNRVPEKRGQDLLSRPLLWSNWAISEL